MRAPAGGRHEPFVTVVVWPWLVIAGLGAFHGINPAMGWLFAVALGLHRNSQRIVLLSIVPIGIGHTAAVLAAVGLFVLGGQILRGDAIRWGAAALLVGWAIYHLAYGHRRRVRHGMQTGLAGLFAWSFLMASAHGAGLMLFPALVPLCLSGAQGSEFVAAGSMATALAAVGVHTAAMLGTTAIVAVAVYRWIGVAFLRRKWINLDLVWTVALFVAAAVLALL